MAEVVEAPLKRKLQVLSEPADCKKPRDCVASHVDALEPAPGNLHELSAQSNGGQKPDGQVNSSGEAGATTVDVGSCNSDRDSEFRLHEQAPCLSTLPSEEAGEVQSGEVVEQDEGDEEDDCGEMSELDTENGSENEEEDEDDEAGSDDDSDSDEEEDLMLTGTSSSLQVEAVHTGKGKDKVDDVKGKGVLPLDKGKGKAIAENDFVPVSDEDDAGYMSEDPLEEVDLNNILPTRTRRRSSTHHYDFVDQDDGGDDEDDDDSDA